MPSLIGRCGGGGTSGAWATLRRDHSQGEAFQSIPNTTFTFATFAQFVTTDTTRFQTSLYPSLTPTNAAGDNVLLMTGPGIYIIEAGCLWVNNFNAFAQLAFSMQSVTGPSYASPANWAKIVLPGQPPIGGPGLQVTEVYAVAATPSITYPAVLVVEVYQASGVAQDLQNLIVRVACVPSTDTYTTVFGNPPS